MSASNNAAASNSTYAGVVRGFGTMGPAAGDEDPRDNYGEWADRCLLRCGDDPASDYRLADGHRPPSGVDTLRLCNECVQIRRAAGEVYENIAKGGDVDDQRQSAP